MRLLLDTHIALWAVTTTERVGDHALGWIANPGNEIAVSVAALWEIAIKRSVSRRPNDTPILSPSDAKQAFADAQFDVIAIAVDHLEAVEKLPFHNRDPFDRLFVATAIADGYHLLTHDQRLAAYGDHVIVV